MDSTSKCRSIQMRPDICDGSDGNDAIGTGTSRKARSLCAQI